ncbi:MAG: XRE family transcriptional regulator [Bacteroidetes bacterium]|nr:XRE family transcriptional regulator [Bacteroidota bacterium]
MPLTTKQEKKLQSIGEKLRELRKNAGYKSYETFAFDNELNRVQYGRMEKGANTTIASLLRVLEIHKLTLEDFFTGIK